MNVKLNVNLFRNEKYRKSSAKVRMECNMWQSVNGHTNASQVLQKRGKCTSLKNPLHPILF